MIVTSTNKNKSGLIKNVVYFYGKKTDLYEYTLKKIKYC